MSARMLALLVCPWRRRCSIGCCCDALEQFRKRFREWGGFLSSDARMSRRGAMKRNGRPGKSQWVVGRVTRLFPCWVRVWGDLDLATAGAPGRAHEGKTGDRWRVSESEAVPGCSVTRARREARQGKTSRRQLMGCPRSSAVIPLGMTHRRSRRRHTQLGCHVSVTASLVRDLSCKGQIS